MRSTGAGVLLSLAVSGGCGSTSSSRTVLDAEGLVAEELRRLASCSADVGRWLAQSMEASSRDRAGSDPEMQLVSVLGLSRLEPAVARCDVKGVVTMQVVDRFAVCADGPQDLRPGRDRMAVYDADGCKAEFAVEQLCGHHAFGFVLFVQGGVDVRAGDLVTPRL